MSTETGRVALLMLAFLAPPAWAEAPLSAIDWLSNSINEPVAPLPAKPEEPAVTSGAAVGAAVGGGLVGGTAVGGTAVAAGAAAGTGAQLARKVKPRAASSSVRRRQCRITEEIGSRSPRMIACLRKGERY